MHTLAPSLQSLKRWSISAAMSPVIRSRTQMIPNLTWSTTVLYGCRGLFDHPEMLHNGIVDECSDLSAKAYAFWSLSLQVTLDSQSQYARWELGEHSGHWKLWLPLVVTVQGAFSSKTHAIHMSVVFDSLRNASHLTLIPDPSFSSSHVSTRMEQSSSDYHISCRRSKRDTYTFVRMFGVARS